MNLLPMRSTLFPTLDRPFDRDLASIQNEMSSLMDSFLGRNNWRMPLVYDTSAYPALDMQEADDKYVIEVEAPGMTEDEIDLNLHNNILTIKGEKTTESKKEREGFYRTERYFGAFRRDIPFDQEVDPDNVKAKLKQGVLTVELMKKEKGKTNQRKIEIRH